MTSGPPRASRRASSDVFRVVECAGVIAPLCGGATMKSSACQYVIFGGSFLAGSIQRADPLLGGQQLARACA